MREDAQLEAPYRFLKERYPRLRIRRRTHGHTGFRRPGIGCRCQDIRAPPGGGLGMPRIGVFICHCGHNIASTVSVEEVVKFARTLPDVVLADHNLYSCSEEGL